MTTDPELTVAEKRAVALASWIPEDHKFELSSTKEAYIIANLHHALYGRFPHDYEHGVESKVDQILSLIHAKESWTTGDLIQEILKILDGESVTYVNANEKLLNIKNSILHRKDKGMGFNHLGEEILEIIQDGFTKEQNESMLKGYELQNDPNEIPGERDRF